jgi:LmbE family N-acetylglucosaminyl deacetylase
VNPLALLPKAGASTILCLGAHSDDIEIGCGGTILRLIAEHPRLAFHWVVLSAAGARRKEARASAGAFLRGASSRTVVLREFRDGFFPYKGGEIKDFFETLKRDAAPNVIFTHARSDLHQDHRLVSELTWNTFRDHLILEYEIPKYDGDLGAPNVFVPLEERICRKKIRLLHRHFRSQLSNSWFDEDTFRALMRLRGLESNAPSRFAEAFTVRKLALR